MYQLWLDELADEAPLHPIDIVRDILAQVESLPRLMEIHYLLREPGLLEIMRGLGSLPEDERQRLLEYLSRHDQKRLRVRQSPTGTLILEFVDEIPFDGGA
jgi:hypothetical protein